MTQGFDEWKEEQERIHNDYDAENAWYAGAKSRQSEMDELKKRIDALEKTEFKLEKVKSILENHMQTKLLESIVVKRLINFVIKGENHES